MQVYDYYETGDGTKVTHSDVQHDGSVSVFFDNHDKHAEIRLSEGVVMSNDGFSDAQCASFRTTTSRGARSIMRYAAEGGVDHAWGPHDDGERITAAPAQPNGTWIGRYHVPDLTDLFAGYDNDCAPREDGFTAPAGRETL